MTSYFHSLGSFFHRLFWPGLTHPEVEGAEDLPGKLGCPFMGTPQIYTEGDPSYGGGNYYRKAAKALGQALGRVPMIWKYYCFGKPFAVVSGGKTLQRVLNMEFGDSLANHGADLIEGGLMPTKSLLYEREKKRHAYLRRLVGAALTPRAVAKAAPTLQLAAEEQVSRMLKNNHGEVKFLKVCTDYTLDIAWRQILGLQLTEEEIPTFEENVATWIEKIMSVKDILIILTLGNESSPGYRARAHVVSKIEERIDQLLEQGPDNKSTLSEMVFATDEDGTGKKLTRQEIIDNSLLLIFAGSETAARTLTNAMLFLGLHPGVWEKLVQEQEAIREQHGDQLTVSNTNASNAPYLDAVLKETMRLRTFRGIPRTVLKDIDVHGDGKTIIPKGFQVDPSLLLTHEYDPSTMLPGGMHMDAIQGFRPERWLGTRTRRRSSSSSSSSSSSDSSSSNSIDCEKYSKPNPQWYVPYGCGPRHCLGRNLAQLEMKIFLATVARKLEFPRLSMLPDGYDYSSNKKAPGSENYFSVQWGTDFAVIPAASDGVLATVTSAKEKA